MNMNSRMWATLAITALAALAITAASQASTPNTRAMTLAPGDLPTGFSQTGGTGERPNALVAKQSNITLSKLAKWGRISGYEVDYTRDVSLTSVFQGAASVTADVSLYKAPAGAHASFADNVKRCNTKPSMTLTLGQKIGDEAVLCAITKKETDVTAKVYVVIWRSGRVYASIIAAGVDGGIAPEEAVALAVKQQRRIAA